MESPEEDVSDCPTTEEALIPSTMPQRRLKPLTNSAMFSDRTAMAIAEFRLFLRLTGASGWQIARAAYPMALNA
jgi:hypothetical protein